MRAVLLEVPQYKPLEAYIFGPIRQCQPTRPHSLLLLSATEPDLVRPWLVTPRPAARGRTGFKMGLGGTTTAMDISGDGLSQDMGAGGRIWWSTEDTSGIYVCSVSED